MILKKHFLQALVGRKKLHVAQMTKKKNSCTAASKKKKMLQSYFIRALQTPSKTATIQWLIFDETRSIFASGFVLSFLPWMVCHHKRHNFVFSLLGLFFGRRLQSEPLLKPGGWQEE